MSQEEYKNMAPVLTGAAACSALAGSSPSTQGLTVGGRGSAARGATVPICNAMLHFPSGGGECHYIW